MQKEETKSDVVIEVSEGGISQIRLYADTPEERERGVNLLSRCAPELRQLEIALMAGLDKALKAGTKQNQ